MLLANRSTDRSGWYWIGEPGLKTLDKKRANKYLLACILDYQIQSGRAWENAKRLAESILGDPPCLWESITEIPFLVWRHRFREYGLHRFPVAHERVWRIGKRVVDGYAGDARQVWKGLSPAKSTAALITLGVGEQLSRMAVGGLFDCGWLKGKSDVKADVHVKRVVGRVCLGRPATEDEAIDLARHICPDNPWLIDSALWQAGYHHCRPKETFCVACFLNRLCSFAANLTLGMPLPSGGMASTSGAETTRRPRIA